MKQICSFTALQMFLMQSICLLMTCRSYEYECTGQKIISISLHLSIYASIHPSMGGVDAVRGAAGLQMCHVILHTERMQTCFRRYTVALLVMYDPLKVE